ncbi:MAG: hypothetical protein K0S38_870 [Candidatus Paceibacter sp.]|jgi:hypothetical protein|nr:hypothetical protein [Candidatus Paceibacter sp.]
MNPTHAAIKDFLAKLKEGKAFKDAEKEADRAIRPHEKSSNESGHITQKDLATEITSPS